MRVGLSLQLVDHTSVEDADHLFTEDKQPVGFILLRTEQFVTVVPGQ